MTLRLGLISCLAAVAVLGCGPGTSSVVIDEDAEQDYGFYSQEKLREHYSKHGREFGEISMDEYLQRAKNLRDSPVGGAILQIIRADTVRTRYDQSLGNFIAFDKDLTIRTFFRPNDGERYFRRQATRPR